MSYRILAARMSARNSGGGGAQEGIGAAQNAMQAFPNAPEASWMAWRSMAIVFVVFAVIGFLIYRGGDVFGNIAGNVNLGDSGPSRITDEGLAIRQCNITETQCPGTKNCRGPTGQVTGARAITSTGDKCCMFGCEDDYMEIRPCKSTEKVCGVGQACKMGDNVLMPEAVTASNRSCCKFECDDGSDLPVRMPFDSETVCPPGSYCMDFQGKPAAPKARMENGNSICQYTKADNPCITP